MKNACKICRRLQQKIFLKGEKCLSPKCPMVRRPYPPGAKKKKKRGHGKLSEYGKELAEKQKLKKYYGLSERQFRAYVKNILKKRGGQADAALSLISKLEHRLDNVIFRLGFAKSRREARVLVSHSHFLVNGRPVNVASFATKKGDKIVIKESKKNRINFRALPHLLKNYQAPAWLKLDKDKVEGSVVGEPTLDNMESAVDISAIFEFYSR